MFFFDFLAQSRNSLKSRTPSRIWRLHKNVVLQEEITKGNTILMWSTSNFDIIFTILPIRAINQKFDKDWGESTFGINAINDEVKAFGNFALWWNSWIAKHTSKPITSQLYLKNDILYPSGPGDLSPTLDHITSLISWCENSTVRNSLYASVMDLKCRPSRFGLICSDSEKIDAKWGLISSLMSFTYVNLPLSDERPKIWLLLRLDFIH